MTNRPLPPPSVAQRLLVGAVALTTACATTTVDLPQPDRRLASLGNLGARSNFEIRTLYAAQDPAPAPADQKSERRRAVTPVLFYLGVTVAALAGGATIATGTASYGLRRKLDDNYFKDGFTYDEYNRTVERGDRLSKAAWGLGFTAVAFAAMALISYSVDWSRCGPLAPKRRRDTAPAGRCEEFHPNHAAPPPPEPAGPGLSPGPAAPASAPAPAPEPAAAPESPAPEGPQP